MLKSVKIHGRFLPDEDKKIQRHVAKLQYPWTISAWLRHKTVTAAPGKRTQAKQSRTTSPRR